jgi:hypothetical protein
MSLPDPLDELGHLNESVLASLGLALEAGPCGSFSDRREGGIAKAQRFLGQRAALPAELGEIATQVEVLESVDSLGQRQDEVVDHVLKLRIILVDRVDRFGAVGHASGIGRRSIRLKGL